MRDHNRRDMLRGAALGAGGLALAGAMPAWAQPVSTGIVRPLPTVSGDDITLSIAHRMLTIDGRMMHGIGINGTVPGPLIRLREGQTARLTVENGLDEVSSIHWHGLLVPPQMDGVPGISFPGIPARGRFVYSFPVIQSGTYWYHSHSAMQEPAGVYGPLVIDPAGPDPIASDREHVVTLSDHSPMHPHMLFTRMKQQGGYFNYQKQTLAGLLAGRDQSLAERVEWGRMRMDPTDVSDVTGSTYHYLVNGYGPRDNWTALFRPGERVRLRIINASAMTTFNVRIPGLRLTVVAADGLPVRPVTIDEFQIGVAETYDVIVTPAEDRAFTLIGEAVDRSGLARFTLAPREGMATEMPLVRQRPIANMTDMGMDMSSMAAPAAAGPMAGHDMAGMDHSQMAGMDHGAGGAMEMDMSMRNPANAPGVTMGPGVQTISPMPIDRMDYPGQGLDGVEGETLTYKALVALAPNPDVRAPGRTLKIHLTGNMERYMWSFDGEKYSEVTEPIPFVAGERVRVTLVNDTMMGHPIHLHGHFFELVTGQGDHAPRKHTVMVQPGGTATFDLTADAVGDWAFHCHMFFHMHAGMMRMVSVRPAGAAA